MVSIPQNGLATSFTYSYHQERSAEFIAVNTDSGEQSRVSVSASQSVTITGQIERNLAYAPNGVAKYQAIADAPPKSQAANNILSFISLRLQQDVADGATGEELISRLQAGYEGFLKGYGEAYEQLVGTGLLSPEVESVIERTKELVLAGIESLAEEYGIESPIAGAAGKENNAGGNGETVVHVLNTSAPVSLDPHATFAKFANQLVKPGAELETLLNSTTINYEALEKRDFSFSLVTKDGDTVNISASSVRGERGSRGETERYGSSGFDVQVDGELDEDELKAINHLLDQVGSLSESFFEWNIEEAFEMALEIGFDETEIASFSLNLQQELTTVVQSTYSDIQDEFKPHEGKLGSFKENYDLAQKDSSISRLMNFVKMLQELVYHADEMGVKRSDIARVVGGVTDANSAADQDGKKLESFVSKMLRNFS